MKRRIYIGSYTHKHNPPRGEGIYLYDFDDEEGALEKVCVNSDAVNPSWITFSKTRDVLYATEESREASAISAFRIAGDELVWIGRIVTEERNLCHLSLWPGERFLTASSYSSGSLVTVELDDEGNFLGITDIIRHQGSGPHPQMQQGAHVHSAFPFPDGKHLLASDLGSDTLTVYEMDPCAKLLVEKQVVQVEPGEGPRHVAFSPDGRFVTMAAQLGNHFHVFPVTKDGLGERIQKLGTCPDTYQGPCEGAADVHYSADGRFVYGSNRGHNSIVVCKVEEDGTLTSRRWFSCEGDGPKSFYLTEDQRFIYIANQYSGNVVVKQVEEDGAIGETVTEVKIPKAVFVAERG